MRDSSIRCFIAIELPDSIQRIFEEIQNVFKSRISNASWTKLGNFHLTLKFLGDVKQNRISKICSVVDNISNEHASFRLCFGGIGAFPSMSRPRVLWIGLKQGVSQTTRLWQKINSEMLHLGFKNEKRFHPHTTLARMRSRENLSRHKDLFCKYDSLPNTILTVNEIVLVESKLHPSGAVYTPFKKFQLSREIVDNGE